MLDQAAAVGPPTTVARPDGSGEQETNAARSRRIDRRLQGSSVRHRHPPPLPPPQRGHTGPPLHPPSLPRVRSLSGEITRPLATAIRRPPESMELLDTGRSS